MQLRSQSVDQTPGQVESSAPPIIEYSQESPEIFFSYAREDRERAEFLAHALQDEGFSVWWDVSIPAGKTFDKVIEQALTAAHCVIVLWSKNSVDNRWVLTEAQDGADREVLVPILIDEVKIPLAFRRLEAANLIEWTGDKTDPAFLRLISDISNVLKAGSKTPVESKLPLPQSEAVEHLKPAHDWPVVNVKKVPDRRVPPNYRRWAIGFGGGIFVVVLITLVLGWLLSVNRGNSTPQNVPITPAQTTGTAPGATTRPVESVNQTAVSVGKALLSSLDKTRHTGPDFDYWPKGGIRIAYYHLATFAGYETLTRLSPHPVFVSGPHGTDHLNLNAPFDFGHYNPEFLRWFEGQLSEILKDQEFVKRTTPLFQTYLGSTADSYRATYRALNRHPDELAALLQDYKIHLDNRTLPEGYYYNVAWSEAADRYTFLKELNASYDPNVTAPAVYFWLRRYIDGTHQQVFSMLESLLNAYQMTESGRITDTPSRVLREGLPRARTR